jgi:phage terminase Nu1 subunit (DNA packaging protein)
MANTVTLDKLCPEIFGISDRRYRQLAKEGIVPPVVDGRVDFVAATKHLLAYYQKLVEGQGAITLTEERARLTKFMAEKTRMEVEKLRGTLVDASEVERTWMAMGQVCRLRLLALPVKVSPLLDGLDKRERKQVLEDNISAALDELAVHVASKEFDVEAELRSSAPATEEKQVKKSMGKQGNKKKGGKDPARCVDCRKRISRNATRCPKCSNKLNVQKRWNKKSHGQDNQK